ncbi:MAG TPA: fatty acid desaturase [Methylophilaceae bacterium]
METTISNTSDITTFYGVSDKERSAIAINYIAFEALIYIHFLLAIFGYLPMWTFCVAVFLYIPRWMISLHESQHFYNMKTVNPITKYNTLTVTPFQLGYREMRDIHMRHHAYTVTEQDPEYYHIRGHWLAGYINVMFSPEQSTYYWIRDKGIDAELIKGMALRFAIFAAIVIGFGWQSLWYFIPVRVAYGSCLYLFSYGLHRQRGAEGTFQNKYPMFLQKIMSFLYGEILLQSITEHDIHHDYPNIAGHRLKASRPFYIPRRSRETSAEPVA